MLIETKQLIPDKNLFGRPNAFNVIIQLARRGRRVRTGSNHMSKTEQRLSAIAAIAMASSPNTTTTSRSFPPRMSESKSESDGPTTTGMLDIHDQKEELVSGQGGATRDQMMSSAPNDSMHMANTVASSRKTTNTMSEGNNFNRIYSLDNLDDEM